MRADTLDGLFDRIEHLNSIGISLSAEKDGQRLMERILAGAMSITNADGGTVYLLGDDKRLRFEIMRNRSLGIELGGTTGKRVMLPPIALYDQEGRPNTKTIAAYCAITGETVNIADVYSAAGFDFSGTKRYDNETGYQSRSFLTLPLRDHENQIIGVLQLINAMDPSNAETVPFSTSDQRLAQSVASQAAVALTNNRLILELRLLLETFVEVLASTIDEKSPYTGSHCRRVPEIAMMMAHAVNRTDTGPLAAHQLSDPELYELRIAALLHDCGKVTTPVHVIDKATKLETIFDRIELVNTRIEILRKQARIQLLEEQLAAARGEKQVDLARTEQDYRAFLRNLDENETFLRQCNTGSEFMKAEDQGRVHQIGLFSLNYENGEERPLLTENEVYNLKTKKGTLTAEERTIINNHMVTTLKMLEALPFPLNLKNVPDIAGSHHERMDGKGYPRGLKGEQMSVQARLMCIADVFEALTAADRPYKKPMPISQALKIMDTMSNEGHLDPHLFDVFMREKVYLEYGEKFLRPEQLDTIDLASLKGHAERTKIIFAQDT